MECFMHLDLLVKISVYGKLHVALTILRLIWALLFAHLCTECLSSTKTDHCLHVCRSKPILHHKGMDAKEVDGKDRCDLAGGPPHNFDCWLYFLQIWISSVERILVLWAMMCYFMVLIRSLRMMKRFILFHDINWFNWFNFC